MPTISYRRHAEADEATQRVYEDIMRTYGLDEPRGIYLLMGHTPTHLAGSWPRSRYIYGRDTNFSVKEKHIFTLAISATNNCEYCCRSHTTRLRQFAMSDAEILEVLMVVDVTNGESKFAEGTRFGNNPVLPPMKDSRKTGHAGDSLDRDADHLGGTGTFYELMAYKPDYQSASWSRRRMCFEEDGHLGVRLKHIIAFTVAATTGADHLIREHTARLRELEISPEAVAELLFIIDVVCGYNRYVQGVQVDPLEGQRKPWGRHADANKAVSCG